MKYFPSENYLLSTKLSVDEIRTKISEQIVPKKLFMLSLFGERTTKPYEGTLTQEGFRINRILQGRNSWRPTITGKITKDTIGTKIQINMRMITIIEVVMFVFLGMFGFLFICLTYVSISKGNFKGETLGIFLFFILLYVIMTVSFKYESLKSKKFLVELFEAEIKNE